jgi:hypothetical protein
VSSPSLSSPHPPRVPLHGLPLPLGGHGRRQQRGSALIAPRPSRGLLQPAAHLSLHASRSPLSCRLPGPGRGQWLGFLRVAPLPQRVRSHCDQVTLPSSIPHPPQRRSRLHGGPGGGGTLGLNETRDHPPRRQTYWLSTRSARPGRAEKGLLLFSDSSLYARRLSKSSALSSVGRCVRERAAVDERVFDYCLLFPALLLDRHQPAATAQARRARSGRPAGESQSKREGGKEAQREEALSQYRPIAGQGRVQ